MNYYQKIQWIFCCASSVALSLFASAPVVNNVVLTQEDRSRQVSINYSLAEQRGIVTLDILTNGVSIGSENIQYVSGDVNKLVEPGPHTITWRPDLSWPGHRVENATARVYAWSEATPPNYMVVDLIQTGKINYYVSEGALPGGIKDNHYRTDKLLMRLIRHPNGGEWRMGSPKGEAGRIETVEKPHYVNLTEDYWIGVFEITQKQWEFIKGDRPSSFRDDLHPVESVAYDTIRGSSAVSYYPKPPAPDSFLAAIRSRTGLDFDLPSEMLWEYACRAGTISSLNSGANISKPQERDPEMDRVGCYKFNNSEEKKHFCVGSFLPNAWGLYDMHGNVMEWCLDWFKEDITDLNGAVNVVQSECRVLRGGSWIFEPKMHRSAYRHSFNPAYPNSNYGFRLYCPVQK